MKKLILALLLGFFASSEQVSAQTAYQDETVSLENLMRLPPQHTRPYYIPPRIQGDADFKNRVEVYIAVRLRITQIRNGLEAQIYMDAKEGRHDWTRAAGNSPWFRVYSAPAGKKIIGLPDLNGVYRDELTDWVQFLTTDSCCSPFIRLGQHFVDKYWIVADTDGDEAGSRTGVSVYFRPVRVKFNVIY